MLTSPMIQNSPSNIPSSTVRNTAYANTDEDMQIPSFGKALAQEMNAKGNAPETRPADTNTKAGDIPEETDTAAGDSKNMTDAKDSTELEDLRDLKDTKELKELENSKDMKDIKDVKDVKGMAVNSPEMRETREMMIDTAAASPQLMDLGSILHGLIAAYRPEGRTDTQANTATDAANALTDIRTGLAATTEQQASLGAMQPGMAAVHLGKDGIPGVPDAAAIADTSDLMPGNPSMLAAALTTPAKAKHAPDIQDIRSGTAIKLEPGATQSDLQQIVPGVPASDQPINTTGPGKSLLESALSAPKDFLIVDPSVAGLTNTPMPLGAVSAERSVAPAAGAFAHSAFGLEPRIGATGWDNALGQKVLWMASNQQQVAELTLNPSDLGPLQVVLSVNNDQASATFISQNIDVRQALEAALPRLREMMADSGINLGETTVSADTSQRQGTFGQQDRSHARNSGSRETMIGPNIESTGIGMGHIPAGGNRLVDTFA
ncbi:flagellar hook-length control protein FliK [Nitrosospira sp. Nsp5]|uniref:Flagellar hook-length control protein FliK n=1 Tax=Nitrosospira multiformis TaxID=1231 RepID=A0ABY0TE73_9PROT|nr:MULTISPECIES: flagellar hook-length control protein FliK [Nitrosospira]PTR09041.1 flagellar hook-length control protein FliK [Nitrosospira sp. Nsp5]SDQ69608.1 Flagellar hook-length control protein FliK [Nitrosospira multiformis]